MTKRSGTPESRRRKWRAGNRKPGTRSVYQTRDKGLPEEIFYNYWNGKQWCGGWTDEETAFTKRGMRFADDPVDYWRPIP